MMSKGRTIEGLAALLTVAAVACVDTTGPEPDERMWQLDFYATRYDAQSGLGLSCRLVQMLADDPPPIEPPWASAVTMQTERQAGSASAPVSRMDDITLDFALDALGPDSVRLVVSGSYSVTVEGAALPFSGGYSGTWTCDSSFPFADDPELLGAGLDPAESIQGSWSLAPVPLPD